MHSDFFVFFYGSYKILKFCQSSKFYLCVDIFISTPTGLMAIQATNSSIHVLMRDLIRNPLGLTATKTFYTPGTLNLFSIEYSNFCHRRHCINIDSVAFPLCLLIFCSLSSVNDPLPVMAGGLVITPADYMKILRQIFLKTILPSAVIDGMETDRIGQCFATPFIIC